MTKDTTINQFIYKDLSEFLSKEPDDFIISDDPELELDLESIKHIEEQNEYTDVFENLEGIQARENIIQEPEVLDIEKIKLEKYNEGYEKAKEELDPLIIKKQDEDNFTSIIKTKLSDLAINDELQKNISNQISEIIKLICNHLNKILPTDFEKIFSEHLLPIVQSGIQSGYLEIKSHSSRKELIASTIAKYITEDISKIKLIEDDNLNTDDLKVEYNNGSFEYKSDDIISTIDTIITKNL